MAKGQLVIEIDEECINCPRISLATIHSTDGCHVMHYCEHDPKCSVIRNHLKKIYKNEGVIMEDFEKLRVAAHSIEISSELLAKIGEIAKESTCDILDLSFRLKDGCNGAKTSQ